MKNLPAFSGCVICGAKRNGGVGFYVVHPVAGNGWDRTGVDDWWLCQEHVGAWVAAAAVKGDVRIHYEASPYEAIAKLDPVTADLLATVKGTNV